MREQHLSDSVTLDKEAPVLLHLSFHVLAVLYRISYVKLFK